MTRSLLLGIALGGLVVAGYALVTRKRKSRGVPGQPAPLTMTEVMLAQQQRSYREMLLRRASQAAYNQAAIEAIARHYYGYTRGCPYDCNCCDTSFRQPQESAADRDLREHLRDRGMLP